MNILLADKELEIETKALIARLEQSALLDAYMENLLTVPQEIAVESFGEEVVTEVYEQTKLFKEGAK